MKKKLFSLLFAVLMSVHAHAADRIYLDITFSCAVPPPAAIAYTVLYMDVFVWDEVNPFPMSHELLNPTLSQSLLWSDHTLNLTGPYKVWNACVAEQFEQRHYGYDGKYYLISWPKVPIYNVPYGWLDYHTLHVDFTWKLDPNQNSRSSQSRGRNGTIPLGAKNQKPSLDTEP